MTAYPIPTEALDDRLGIVGTSGAGKTYTAMGAVERLLASGARCVIVDPLDVWWGLRLNADGDKASAFKLPILGGAHGDLPLTENSGTLIGETVSGMADSCIVSLGGFSSGAAERRFMLAFLNALYRRSSGSLCHLILDEADLWSPQQVLDKEGGTMQLKGIVENIVRRGRVKGFVPWLITQRPAVIDKSIMSMMVGLIAMKAMSPQDRDAILAWLKGQMTAEQRADLDTAMPNLSTGEGVVWIPGRNVLHRAQFPIKATFDSSRAPQRGEAVADRELKPLDLGELQGRLATVEAEVRANDPKALKAEIARLQKDIAAKPQSARNPGDLTAAEVEAAKRAAFLEGVAEGEKRGNPAGQALMLARVRLALDGLTVDPTPTVSISSASKEVVKIDTRPAPAKGNPPIRQAIPEASTEPGFVNHGTSTGDVLPKPIQKLIDAVACWEAFGLATPTVQQVAFIAGYASTSGTWDTYRSRARTMGLIDLPGNGTMRLTEAGRASAHSGENITSAQDLHLAVKVKLAGPLQRLLDVLLTAYPASVSRADWAAGAGYEPTSGTADTYRSRVMALDLATIPERGFVRAADWLFPGEPA